MMDATHVETMPIQKWFDIVFGLAVMGTVGALIGIIMGGGLMPIAIALGLAMGGVIGFLGGRRFLDQYSGRCSARRRVGVAGGRNGTYLGRCGSRRRDGWISWCADLDAVGYARREKSLLRADGPTGLNVSNGA